MYAPGFSSNKQAGKHTAAFLDMLRDRYGIAISKRKIPMIESRLNRRIEQGGFQNLEDYTHFIMSQGGLRDELPKIINAVTTRTTYFFREEQHFDFLRTNVIGQYVERPTQAPVEFLIWSAASSSGQEAYTLAMVADKALRDYRLSSDFRVVASDISSDALRDLNLAVYPIDAIESIPKEYRVRYLLVNRGKDKNCLRLNSDIRKKVHAVQNNLMNNCYSNIPLNLHVAVIRNVLIYFNKKDQIKVLTNVVKHLRPGGFLFCGHSETIQNFEELGLSFCCPAVYQKKG